MTHLERRIRTVQRRLWFNRWLGGVSWVLCAAAGLFAAVVLVQRLYDFSAPLLWIGMALGGIVLIVPVGWTVLTREGSVLAAAKLDEAAGLRERLSSGRYCLGSEDPFARSCVADAERVSVSLSPRQHIPLAAPRQLTFTVIAIAAAAIVFLVPPGLLGRSEADEVDLQRELTRQTAVAVKRKLDDVHDLLKANPALEDLKEELEGLDKRAGGMLRRPGDIRHEAVKRIDKLADVVRQKRKQGNYQAVREMRKQSFSLRRRADAGNQRIGAI